MDVRAILIVGSAPEPGCEEFAGRPLALLDVLGASPALRLATRLRGYGVDEVTLLLELGPAAQAAGLAAMPQWLRMRAVEKGTLWDKCEEIFSAYAQDGAELVLVQRLGPYVELDYEAVLQLHLDKNGRVTRVLNPQGERLDAFVISASRRNDAAFLFRHRLAQCRSECVDYVFQGYSLPLRSAQDLRQLASDGLFQSNGVAPVGRELRPGVWAGAGAQIHRAARLVAPCFIGERAKVRTAAVITRASSLERFAEADCGAVVEDSSLLPFTKLGPGLDCAHSVAGFQKLAHLPRAVEIEIADSRLLAAISRSPARRAAQHASVLAGLLARALPTVFSSAPAPVPAHAGSDGELIAPDVQSSIEKLKSARREEPASEPSFEKIRSPLHL